MADTKASAFTTTTTMAGTDVFPVVTGIGTTPVNKIISKAAFKIDLALVKADVGLNNVDNTSDISKNTATVALTNKDLTTLNTFPTFNQSTTGNAATVTTNANLTGDVTSVGNATTLATSGVVAGSYTSTSLTVDAKGRITTASNGAGGAGISLILAYSHGGNMANNATIPWDTQLAGATLSSGAWTCSTTGVYEIIANATFGSNPNSKDLQFAARINGTVVAYGSGTPFGSPVGFQWITTLATPLPITAGQVLTITCPTGGTIAASSAYYSLKKLA